VENVILASLPPSLPVLEKVIQSTHPRKVVLGFNAPAQSSPLIFLKHLSGLIQYAVINRGGLANINELAEAANARVESIEAGVVWLVTAGKLRVSARDQDLLEFLIENHPEDTTGKREAEKTIDYLLKETRAFQKYIYSLPVEDLKTLLSGFIKPSISNIKETKSYRK
jgi:hypothetical protein